MSIFTGAIRRLKEIVKGHQPHEPYEKQPLLEIEEHQSHGKKPYEKDVLILIDDPEPSPPPLPPRPPPPPPPPRPPPPPLRFSSWWALRSSDRARSKEFAEGILSMRALSAGCCGGRADTSVVAETIDVRTNENFIVAVVCCNVCCGFAALVVDVL